MSGAGVEGIRTLISEAEIAARVEELAAEIVHRSPGDFVIVGLLKGAAMFVADLARARRVVGMVDPAFGFATRLTQNRRSFPTPSSRLILDAHDEDLADSSQGLVDLLDLGAVAQIQEPIDCGPCQPRRRPSSALPMPASRMA
jgi:hypoxanthine-guanine phosphoribosyltransferase